MIRGMLPQLASCLFLIVLYHYDPVYTGSPYLGNCPKNAAVNDLCENGQGYCDRPGNAPPHSSARLKCYPRENCEEPPAVANGAFIQDPNFEYIFVLNCTAGYVVVGDPCYIGCHPNGSFLGTTPYCDRINCKNPPCVEDGQYILANCTRFMDMGFLQCNEGCSPSIANHTITCGEDGEWTEAANCTCGE